MKKEVKDMLIMREALLHMQGRIIRKNGGILSLLDGTEIAFNEITTLVVKLNSELENHADYLDYVERVRCLFDTAYFKGVK